jgi:hypothetical protein
MDQDLSEHAAQVAFLEKKISLQRSMKGGLGWFYWIAGLSLINTVVFFFGGSITFVVGLGITQFIDGFVIAFSEMVGDQLSILVRLIGFGLDLAVAGIFVLIGRLGLKGYRWIVYIGMALYALDALIFLAFKIWIGVAFHGLALVGLWRGLAAQKELRKYDQLSVREVPSIKQPA